MKCLKPGALALTAMTGLCLPALAHTSYVLPNMFVTSEGNYVTLQASFTEDVFVPEIAVASDDYHVVLPDGSRDAYDSITPLRQVVMLEEALGGEGTYRFTTGVRLGRSSRKALVEGEWKVLMGPDAMVPENATEVITSQTETVADAYVTKGAPTWDAVTRPIGRLVIAPETHPNEVFLDDGFAFRILFDGAPLAAQSVEVKREGGAYEEPKFVQHVETDADGALTLGFDAPGKYLIMTRHAADAPEGADTDERSYTTSLTLEVSR